MSSNIYVENIQCTKCGSSNGMGIYKREDGSMFGKCFKCSEVDHNPYGSIEPTEQKPKKENNSITSKELELIYNKQASFNPLKSRGISKDACEKYGVKSVLDEDGNDTIHFYPVYNYEGKESVSVRIVEDKKFSWINSNPQLEFFGQRVVGSSGKMIIITEGVCDCLAVVDMLAKQGKSYRTVSVNNGSASLVKAVQENYEWLNTFENIFFAFDQDDPGQDAVKKAADLFPPNKVKNIKFSEKDPNEMLRKNKHVEFLQAIYNAKETRPDGIVSVDDLYEEAIKPPEMGLSFPWPTLTETTYGYRDSELWGIGAGSGCVDKDTEFLTRGGWKKISEWDNDVVTQVDQWGEISLITPTRYINEPCDEMYHIKSKYGIDQMLCEQHRVIGYTPNNIEKIVTAKEFVELHNKKVNGNRLGIPTTFTLPHTYGIGLSLDYIRLKIAVFADGCFDKRINTTRCYIKIKKQRKKERLLSLLIKNNITFSEKLRDDGYSVYSFLMDNTDKSFPESWWYCSILEAQTICDEIRYWDSEITKSTFCTSIKKDADFIQYIYSSCGFRAAISETDRVGKDKAGYIIKSKEYRVTKSIRNKPTLHKLDSFVNKIPTIDGRKYCFTVPTGRLLLRRNGKVFITGNCGKTEFFKECIDHTINYHKEIAGVIFLEEPAAKTLKVLAGKKAKKRFHIPADKGGDWTIDELVDGINDLKGKIYLYNHFGAKDWESIKPKIRFMVSALGIKRIYLDHLTALVAQEDNEYKALNRLMEEMSSLCQELNCTIFYISHLRKASGTPHEEGGRVTADQFKGSGAIVFWSNFLIGLERNQQAEDIDERNTTTLRVLKDRNTGLATGVTFKLKYSHETGRWGELDEDEFNEDF